jgi:hypothetical protein
MKKWKLIIFGCGFLILGFLLLLGFILKQGLNDGEWGGIENTGKFSGQEQVVWENWQRDKGRVTTEFLGKENQLPDRGNLEFRKGKASGFFFDFTVYECRNAGDKSKIVPAMGPGWGATYHGIWAFIAISIGVCLLSVGKAFRNPA